MNSNANGLMIWVNDGSTWLQVDVGGVCRTSYVGNMSLSHVELFCQERGIPLTIHRRPRQPAGPVECPSRAQIVRSEFQPAGC